MTDLNSQPEVQPYSVLSPQIEELLAPLANINYGIPILKALTLDYAATHIIQKYVGKPLPISPALNGAISAGSYIIRDIAREYEHPYIGGGIGGAFKYGTKAFFLVSAIGASSSLGGVFIIGFAAIIGGLNHATYEYDKDNNLGQHTEKFAIGFATAVEGIDNVLMSPVGAYTQASTIKTITYTINPVEAGLKFISPEGSEPGLVESLKPEQILTLTKGVTVTEVISYKAASLSNFLTVLKDTTQVAKLVEGAAVGGLVSILANNLYVNALPYVKDYKGTFEKLSELANYYVQPVMDEAYSVIAGNTAHHEDL